ncbi:MAG TPA: 4Fe-4S binding protein [Crocinitomix sp.]|nr:4Fe-4S binding protein [Crocinitomix sp.]
MINYSIVGPKAQKLNVIQKIGLIISGLGVSIILLTWAGMTVTQKSLWLTVTILSLIIGIIIYTYGTYKHKSAGVKNDGVFFRSLTNRGVMGWIVAVVLTVFYVFLYWYPEHLGLGTNGQPNTGLVGLFDPLSLLLKGQVASQWFVYGTIYTILILSLGIKFLVKYRHNRYHFIRTLVVICSQLILAYLLPEILEGFSNPDHYFAKDLKYFWPLNYYFFDNWHLENMTEHGGALGMFYFIWGMFMFLVLTPLLTYWVGKRWYCSWVCGCGGLAETAGDSFRHLSNKKLWVWKLERWIIHIIMVLVFIMTIATLYGYFTEKSTFLGLDIYTVFKQPYGFLIGAMFSGVVGVGFYPILGNRVWCRFGCPLAGYMGIIQRFKSRFRITTNGGQCISCGNCSTYCEQGIDVRAYAQKGKNVVRASCVGCGVCATVCPRGVLKLENGPEENRFGSDDVIVLGNDGFKVKE